ncbi:MAG: transglutaminase-like cysteine peptidase [Geminicoccaceae bacterium]
MRKLAILLLAMLIVTPFSQAMAIVPVALFGTAELRAESHAALPKWRDVLDKIEAERGIYEACGKDAGKCPTKGVMAWQALLKGLKGEEPRVQVNKINRFVNQWRYRTDDDNFGKSDYWASPLEFIKRSGDCEDYAITKYVSLRSVGFPAERLRMVVVQDTLRDLAHAVLAVYLDDETVILDNLTNAVLPHDRIFQYVPYYSVNETTRWAHVPPGRITLSMNGN